MAVEGGLAGFQGFSLLSPISVLWIRFAAPLARKPLATSMEQVLHSRI